MMISIRLIIMGLNNENGIAIRVVGFDPLVFILRLS